MNAWHERLTPLKNLESALGRTLYLYLATYLLVVMIIGWWVPSNDIDSMGTYLPAVRIADTAELTAQNSTQAQRFGPLFFMRLQERLTRTGYRSSCVNLAIFAACLYVVAALYAKSTSSLIVLLLFSAQPILVALTSFKNDLPVGTVGLLTALAIFRLPRSMWYASVCLAGIALLVGIKWHGIIVAVPLLVALIYRLSTSHRPTTGSILMVAASIPLVATLSCADRYWKNYEETGRFLPHMETVQYLAHSPREIALNVYKFISCTAIDTLSFPLYFLNIGTNGDAWRFVHSITAGGQDLNFVNGPNAEYSVFGFPLLLVLMADAWAICNSKLSAEVRVLAATSLFYWAAVTSMSQYIGLGARYYIASYVIGAVPLACIATSLSPKVLSVFGAVLIAYMFVQSTQVLLLDPERALISYPVAVRTTQSVDYVQPSIWGRISSRDELYFQSWPGYLPAYQYFTGNVLRSDNVAFINCGRWQDGPFIYPFLRLRENANTAFYHCDDRGSQNAFIAERDFKFLIAYRYHDVADPRYRAVLAQEGFFDIAIYRREL